MERHRTIYYVSACFAPLMNARPAPDGTRADLYNEDGSWSRAVMIGSGGGGRWNNEHRGKGIPHYPADADVRAAGTIHRTLYRDNDGVVSLLRLVVIRGHYDADRIDDPPYFSIDAFDLDRRERATFRLDRMIPCSFDSIPDDHPELDALYQSMGLKDEPPCPD